MVPMYYPIAAYGATITNVSTKDDRVKLIGEIRQPKRGEWYLSGAIPEGYQAPNDLSQTFQICELVRGEHVTTWRPIAPTE